ncbi:hypothetical protein [Streptomyces cinereoruber]|uniref:hypothetical protein n=1 Tax=Streptomyces cinereoruber TaxID=67260 RepID=UPI00363E2DD7
MNLALCHMRDPGQDRAMIVRFAYFRFKWLCSGAELERFLKQRLAPAETIFIVGCALWPMSGLGDGHRFRFGALGGMAADEYVTGGDRAARPLAARSVAVRQ